MPIGSTGAAHANTPDATVSGPEVFIASNVSGTFHLLQAVRSHWEQLPGERKANFRMHHISTDEVFGSLGVCGKTA